MNRLIIAILFLTPLLVFAQEQKDVKVGLVLSGGGAKGLAHIGVLEAIDEAGVRIDYIAGTSMGAIIGGLYASGYSAKELDSIFKTIDFDRLIQDELPRNAKTFYEKSDSEKYALTLPFDNFRITLPSSLSRGQNVYNLFSILTSHVGHINDFSQLPIPFFCMATDIETGATVKLDKGYLPQALRASGALPSVFSPVEIDGRLLIDGGVTDNFPVGQLREKDLDFIIGVDVQDTLRNRERLKSAFEILTQISNYKTITDMSKKRKLVDLYINPDISGFSVVSFDQGASIIESGRAKSAEFKETLDSIALIQKHNRQPLVKQLSDTLHIDKINIFETQFYTRSYLLGKLKLKPPVKISYEKFSEGINNLSATGNFDQINYIFKPNANGENVLYFNTRENPNKTFLRLAVHYDNLYQTGALINITRKRIVQKNDIVSFDFIIGDNLRYNLDYYIDKGYYWSFGIHSDFNKFKKGFSVHLFPSSIIENSGNSISHMQLKHQTLTNQIYVQTLYRQIYSVGAGVEHKHIKLESETLSEESGNNPVFENTNYFSIYGNLKLDNRDNKYFPSQGIYFDGIFHFYVFTSGLHHNQEQFSIAKATLGYSLTPINRVALTLSTEGGVKVGARQTGSLDFFVGGYGFKPINNFVHLLGYNVAAFGGDTFFKATARVDYEFYKKTYLSGIYNATNVGNRLFENTGWINNKPFTGFGLGVASNTYIGPAELFWSYSPETKRSQWFVSIGYWF